MNKKNIAVAGIRNAGLSIAPLQSQHHQVTVGETVYPNSN